MLSAINRSFSPPVESPAKLQAKLDYSAQLTKWAGSDADKLKVANQLQKQLSSGTTNFELSDLTKKSVPPFPPNFQHIKITFSPVSNASAIQEIAAAALKQFVAQVPDRTPTSPENKPIIYFDLSNSGFEIDMPTLLDTLTQTEKEKIELISSDEIHPKQFKKIIESENPFQALQDFRKSL